MPPKNSIIGAVHAKCQAHSAKCWPDCAVKFCLICDVHISPKVSGRLSLPNGTTLPVSILEWSDAYGITEILVLVKSY